MSATIGGDQSSNHSSTVPAPSYEVFAPLVLTTTPGIGYVPPSLGEGEVEPARVWLSFGSLDGFIPSGLMDPVCEFASDSTDQKERRIWLKATPLARTEQYVKWQSLTIEKSAEADLYASEMPDQGAINEETGLRAYYLIPIGVARWIVTDGNGALSLSSDDIGSIRSDLRNGAGSYTASDGPDNPPTFTFSEDLIFRRGSAVA